LFCIAPGTEWARAGITGATATAMVVKGLIERDSGDELTLTKDDRASRGDHIGGSSKQHTCCYAFSYYAGDGGLLSYGPDQVDTLRRAATYVDRILKGEKPVDLPVQFPTKFEMVLNLKTARGLGLAIPRSILLRADEVIE
jgi:putative ABC transport system substrate-binding protein